MHLDDWTPVTLGLSGAEVRRHPGGSAYAKTAHTPGVLAELERERDVLTWLAGRPVGAPRVLDWVGERTLVTETLPGVPLSSLPHRDAAERAAALLEVVLDLHALPVTDCPFSRRLADTVPAARRRVAAGLVDASDFDAERLGLSAEDAMVILEADLAGAAALEEGSIAVCHGDFSLANVLVDPATLRPSGILDVGRLGAADRHLDLALAYRELTGDEGPGREAAGLLTAYADATGLAVDPGRLGFYRLLDEFF